MSSDDSLFGAPKALSDSETRIEWPKEKDIPGQLSRFAR